MAKIRCFGGLFDGREVEVTGRPRDFAEFPVGEELRPVDGHDDRDPFPMGSLSLVIVRYALARTVDNRSVYVPCNFYLESPGRAPEEE